MPSKPFEHERLTSLRMLERRRVSGVFEHVELSVRDACRKVRARGTSVWWWPYTSTSTVTRRRSGSWALSGLRADPARGRAETHRTRTHHRRLAAPFDPPFGLALGLGVAGGSPRIVRVIEEYGPPARHVRGRDRAVASRSSPLPSTPTALDPRMTESSVATLAGFPTIAPGPVQATVSSNGRRGDEGAGGRSRTQPQPR